MAKEVLVKVVVDASQVDRGFTKASQTAKKFEKDMGQMNRGRSFGKGALGAFGLGALGGSVAGATASIGAGVLAGLKSSVDAASSMNEQMSKTNVVFGKSAAQVKAWSRTTTTAFGISRREALTTASSFGALFRPLGIAGQEAADQSERLTELGADLASFYDTDVQASLDAIRSGILGESEPLRQYGVVLSETRVQQQALTDTGKKHVQALTAQEKALARIKIIFEDTKVAQGDYGNTAGGLANQTRQLTANIDDLKVKVGEKLVPALTDATTKTNEFFEAMNEPTKQSSFEAGVDTLLHAGQKFKNFVNPLDPTQPFGQFVGGIKLLGAAKQKFFGPDAAARLTGPEMAAEAGAKAAHGLALVAAKAAAAEVTKFKATPAQRNAWFDAIIGRQLSRVSDAPINQQLGMLQKIAAALTKRIAITKDITRLHNLEDQLYAVAQQKAQVRAEMQQAFFDRLQLNVDMTSLTKTANDDLGALAVQQQAIEKRIAMQGHTLELDQQWLSNQQAIAGKHEEIAAAAKAASEAAKQAREAAQAETLAWADFAEERAAATPGMKDDLKTALAKLALLKQQAGAGKRTAEEARTIWEQQQKVNNLLNKGKTLFRGFNANKWIQQLGLNLNPAQVARLRAGVVQIGRGGTTPQRAQAFAAAGGMTVNGGLHLHGVQDPKQLQNALTKHAKSQPHPRRGAR